MRWYQRSRQDGHPPDPDRRIAQLDPNNVSPPADDMTGPGAAVLPAHEGPPVPVTKKTRKISPGKKKNKIRWAPLGQAGGPALPQDSARPNAASSDPRDLRGM